MKEYDLIIIGSGSAMNIINPYIQKNPEAKIAVIDKDEPGGICLTRGCIPTKILVYPAEMIRKIEESKKLGLDVEVKKVDFKYIMNRMRENIGEDINNIREGLSNTNAFDYYPLPAEFVEKNTLKVGEETIKGNTFFLCTGSKPLIPPIKGLDEVEFLTSKEVLELEELPKSLTIVGGGYIAAEYGHFFSAMGTKVTIIGRNPQFLKQEEPEVSSLAKKKMSQYMKIQTNFEVTEFKQESGVKTVVAVNKDTKEVLSVDSDIILIAAGRSSNSDLLKPKISGIEIDKDGWILVDENLRSISHENVWAFGDANGKHLFKHVGNYESIIVYYNAILGEEMKVDYHAIPKAVFSYPEIASVGMKEKEAIEKVGKENILIGFYKYENTAKGQAMMIKDYFVKVILDPEGRILGAHIIGPSASVLIQEIINLMYTPNRSSDPITMGMHIHPALNEVVERAFGQIMPVENYHHMIKHD